MRPRVLVVDDDETNQELLEELLTGDGLDVVCAPDGIHSLAQFLRSQPDLVLLDIQMPFMDGFEVCRRLKADPDTRLVPVVLITALSAVGDRIRGIRAGADDLLTKPIEATELLARIRALLSVKAFTDELERAESVLFALARSIEGKDPYTEGHCERLSEYSERLGIQIGLSHDEVVALRRAGIVHDIGKVAVPDAILLKPSSLTAQEYDVIKEHPAVGERICSPLKSFRLVLPIIRHHHERLDGSGYPDGLKGAAIPLTARVLQIVDVYDALITQRPYKAAMSPPEAVATLQEEVRKGWWDKDVFAEFQRMLSPAEYGRRSPQSSRTDPRIITNGRRDV